MYGQSDILELLKSLGDPNEAKKAKPNNSYLELFKLANPNKIQKNNNENKYINIKDTRKIDVVSNKKISDKYNKSSIVNKDMLEKIVKSAIKNDIDPYTALAIGLQETGLTEDWEENPFHIKGGDANNIINSSMKFMKEKIDYAKRLGKTTEAEIIQAWNGYGKISPKSEYESKKYYGIDVSKTPLDMNKNPVYGKRVIDLRDNIIMKNEELKNFIEDAKSNSKAIRTKNNILNTLNLIKN
jgi:hypothetical protein